MHSEYLGTERVPARSGSREFDVLAEGFDTHKYSLPRRGRPASGLSRTAKRKPKSKAGFYTDCPFCDRDNMRACDEFYGDQRFYVQYVKRGKVFFLCFGCGAIGFVSTQRFTAIWAGMPEGSR